MASQEEIKTEPEATETAATGEDDGQKGQGEETKKKKKGKKGKDEWSNLVDDEKPMEFKKVDFEHALTKEEKAAKRKAKKKGGKKGGTEAAVEKPAAPEVDEGGEGESMPQTAGKKGKKDKKGKKQKDPDIQSVDIAGLDSKIPSLSELAAPESTETKDEKEEKKKGKKGKKGKGKKGKEETAPLVQGEAAEGEAGEGEGVEVGASLEQEEVDAKKKGKKKKEKKGKKKEPSGEDEETKGEEKVEAENKPKKEKKKKDETAKDKKKKKGKQKEAPIEDEGEGEAEEKKEAEHPIIESASTSVVKFDVPSDTGTYIGREEDEDFDSLEEEEEDEFRRQKKRKAKGGKKGKKEKGKKKPTRKDEMMGEEEEDVGQGPSIVEVVIAPVGAQPPVAPSEEETGKKKKKGKKEKKKKEEQPPEAPPEEEVPDIMKEIMMMKKKAEAAAHGEVVEEEEVKVAKKKKDKKKKTEVKEFEPPKKKLSKKEKLRLEWERLEKARIEAELEAQRKLEAERRRKAEELRVAREHENKINFEQQLRVEHLTNSMKAFEAILQHNFNVDMQAKEDYAWQQYLKCDGLPDPSNCAQMNTYLHLWEQVINDVDMDKAAHRNSEVVKILDELDDLIYDPLDASEKMVKDWKWIRSLFREYQQLNLDTATYRLLRDIDRNLNRIDIPTADYHREEEYYCLNLFAMVQLPTPIYNPRAPPPPAISLDFENMKMTVQFPTTIDCLKMSIRSLYVKYDYLSENCKNYYSPVPPKRFTQELLDSVMDEWYCHLRYRYNNRKRDPPKVIVQSSSSDVVIQPPPEPEPEPEILDPKDIPIVPYQRLDPTPSDYVLQQDEILYNEGRKLMITTVPPNVLNLRRHVLIGGLYILNLFYQPPQYQEMVSYETKLTVLQIPKSLREVEFFVPYKPPPPLEAGHRRTPEEIEEEMKRQELELDKLMFITITLPDTIMWLDVPVVCFWDSEKEIWTTDDVYDMKHVEEKGYITFRTGKFGCFGLATYKYINMPYQTWEIKPESDGTITFQLTAAILMIEFTVKDNLVCISQLQNTPNNALQDRVGEYMRLPKLMRVMKAAGVDVFPEHDAFCYIEGTTCEKHWPMERHTYYNIAQLSHVFNFAWSRWNLNAGRRSIVLQMREYKMNKPKQKPHNMLLVTPKQVLFVDCTEISQSFSEVGVLGMKFYGDLMHLVKGTSGIAVRTKINRAQPKVVKAVADLLIATKVMSFC